MNKLSVVRSHYSYEVTLFRIFWFRCTKKVKPTPIRVLHYLSADNMCDNRCSLHTIVEPIVQNLSGCCFRKLSSTIDDFFQGKVRNMVKLQPGFELKSDYAAHIVRKIRVTKAHPIGQYLLLLLPFTSSTKMIIKDIKKVGNGSVRSLERSIDAPSGIMKNWPAHDKLISVDATLFQEILFLTTNFDSNRNVRCYFLAWCTHNLPATGCDSHFYLQIFRYAQEV